MKFQKLVFGLSIAGLTFAGMTIPAIAQKALPTADRNGDYRGPISHQYWEVVERDPKGLNCRMGNQRIEQIEQMYYERKQPDIASMPVLGTLGKPAPFSAQQQDADQTVIWVDNKGKPWLFVANVYKAALGQCFVRANSQFVRPVGNSPLKP